MSKCRYDLSEDCHNKDCLACVLDKIRTEIAQEYNRLRQKRTDETLELGECLGLKISLKIIDKYKASQTGQEGANE